jgi:hypothetical protein
VCHHRPDPAVVPGLQQRQAEVQVAAPADQAEQAGAFGQGGGRLGHHDHGVRRGHPGRGRRVVHQRPELRGVAAGHRHAGRFGPAGAQGAPGRVRHHADGRDAQREPEAQRHRAGQERERQQDGHHDERQLQPGDEQESGQHRGREPRPDTTAHAALLTLIKRYPSWGKPRSRCGLPTSRRPSRVAARPSEAAMSCGDATRWDGPSAEN